MYNYKGVYVPALVLLSSLVYGWAYFSVLARVPDKGPGQHSNHGQANYTVTCKGNSFQANEEQNSWQNIQEADQDKQHCRCPESTKKILGLKRQQGVHKINKKFWNVFHTLIFSMLCHLLPRCAC